VPIESQVAELAAAAKAAAARAYCPYSRFPVGAAIRTGDGRVFAGSNVENASYGLTICAERSAIFRAVGEGARAVAMLVIYTPTPAPVTPCGACRQVLSEFGADADVVCVCDGPERLAFKGTDLLPHGFTL
jgi:cytidine deaminase